MISLNYDSKNIASAFLNVTLKSVNGSVWKLIVLTVSGHDVN